MMRRRGRRGKVGIIGAGFIGPPHAAALALLPDGKAAIASPGAEGFGSSVAPVSTAGLANDAWRRHVDLLDRHVREQLGSVV